MSVLDELGTYLVGAGVVTAKGTDLFLNYIPDSPSTCTVLVRYEGAPAEQGFGVDGIQYETPGVQVRCRGEEDDEGAAETQAAAVANALAKIQGNVLSGTQYLMVRVLQAPFELERDENDRPTWAFNIHAQKEPS